MAEPILYGDLLQDKKILSEFYMEYIDGQTFSPFMGGPESVIHLIDDLTKGEGDQIVFSLLQALDPDVRFTGMQQAQGNGEGQTVRSDQVRVQQIRKPAKLEGVAITAQRTPIDLFGALRPQLLDCVQQMMRNDIIDSAVYAAGGSSPVQNRSLFGNADSNYNATINTALATIDSTNDKLTVDHIRKLKRKAVMGGTTAGVTPDRKLRPFKIETDMGFKDEYFVLFVDPRASADLLNDPIFENIALQGKFEEKAPSLVRGSRFIGMIDSVLIFEVPELSRIGYATAGNGGTPVAHNLFCGAQAFGIGIAMQSKFEQEYSDFTNIFELCHIEMRGNKMLKFSNGTTLVENGVIHSFTTAANA